MSDEKSEELRKIWKDDKLGRMEDAELIRRFLIGQIGLREKSKKPTTFVLNIDSQWGGGKTFFLTRFKEHLERENHICVYVNAWEDDHCDDPLIAVVSAITATLQKLSPRSKYKGSLTSVIKIAGKILVSTAIKTAQHQIEKVAGEGAVSEISATLSDAAVDAIGASVLQSFEDQKQTIEDFKTRMSALAENALASQKKDGPLFILVDELDRCRPNYAIQLLERVKHLFSVENIVFVIATDTSQLSKAVSGVYGVEFDGSKYLHRFFDRTYYFPKASPQQLIEEAFSALGLDEQMFDVPPDQTVIGFLAQLCSIDEVEPRDIKRMLEVLHTFVSVWEYSNIKINLALLFPLIYQIHQHRTDKDGYRNEMLDVIISFTDRSGATNHPRSDSLSKINKTLLNIAKRNFENSGNRLSTLDSWSLDIVLNERQQSQKSINERIASEIPLQSYQQLVRILDRLKSSDPQE